ncbi:MAG: hypothetical protein ACKVW3_06915 [Phycisphaerales bacterium]
MATDRPRDLRADRFRNEAELGHLRDLPVGDKDPATRERELDRRQDEIEHEIGMLALAKARGGVKPIEGIDPEFPRWELAFVYHGVMFDRRNAGVFCTAGHGSPEGPMGEGK